MKKTRLLTRKRKAIRVLLATLICVLLFNYVYGVGLLLPAQAVWEAEQATGCGQTERISREWDTDMYRLLYLRANENAVLLVGTQPTVLGWDVETAVTDSGEAAPFHGNVLRLQMDGGPTAVYAFGCIDDPDIAEIQLSFQFTPNSEQEDHWKTYVYTTTETDWYRQYGERYFLIRSDTLNMEVVSAYRNGYDQYREQGQYGHMILMALDFQGNVVAEIEC